MKYSIIIPTYNHCDDFLKPCIESIFKYTDMTDVELIVSANGCVDNTKWYLTALQSQFEAIGFGKHLKVVWSDAPLGYSGANNVAIKEAIADKIVLLNNDCLLLAQDKNRWIEMLDSAFQNPKCGISCVVKGPSEPAGHDFAIFFCVMIHRNVFNKIGLLNEEYGVGGGEDTEFCIEAERAGFEVIECSTKYWGGNQFTGVFPIYHKGEGTVHDPNLVKDWTSIFLKNSLKLAQKYNPAWFEKKTADLQVSQVGQNLSWLCENGPEAQELYREVVVDNAYRVSKEVLLNRPVIDIGANMGTFSILAASLGASKVVAVEPVSTTFKTLIDNVSKADVANKVFLKKAVVSDKPDQKVNIGINTKSGHNSLYKSEGAYEEVSSTTLSQLLEMVDGDQVFLKMDCEGAEYDILMNASEEDMARISTLAIEVHSDLHPTYRGLEPIENKLKSFGLKLIDRKQNAYWEYDQFGNMMNYREIPMTNEIWMR